MMRFMIKATALIGFCWIQLYYAQWITDPATNPNRITIEIPTNAGYAFNFIKKLMDRIQQAAPWKNYYIEMQKPSIGISDDFWAIASGKGYKRELWSWYQKANYSPIILAPSTPEDCLSTSMMDNYNMIALSWCNDDALQNRDRYEAIYTVDFIESARMMKTIEMIPRFGWKRFFYVTANEPAFIRLIQDARAKARELGLNMEETIINLDMKETFDKLKEADARIVMLLSLQNTMRFLCNAYEQGFRAPKVVFLVQLYWAILWDDCWKHEGMEHMNITKNQYMAGVIGLQDTVVEIPKGFITEVFVPEWEITKLWEENIPGLYEDATPHVNRLLTLRKLLMEVDKRLEEEGDTLQNYVTKNAMHGRRVYEIMQDVLSNPEWTVNGRTGTIERFDQQEKRRVTHAVKYYDEAGRDAILFYFIPTLDYWTNKETTKAYVIENRMISGQPRWFSLTGEIPMDGVHVTEYTIDVNIGLYAASCAFACFSALLSLILMGHQFYYRDTPFIRLGSPRLNLFMLSGFIIMCASTFLHRVEVEVRNSMFVLRTFLFVNGCSLVFSVLLGKVYRVHYVFVKTGKKDARKMRDNVLLRFVLAWLVLNNAILVTWFTTDDLKTERTFIEQRQDTPLNQDLVSKFYFYNAYTSNQDYFVTTIILIQAGMILCSAFLAFLTREVVVKEVNDKDEIYRSIYLVAIFGIVGLMALFFMTSQINISFAVINFIINLGSLTVQIILFNKRLPFLISKENMMREDYDFDMSTGKHSNSRSKKTAVPSTGTKLKTNESGAGAGGGNPIASLTSRP